MQDLKIIGVESDALFAVTDEGNRFRIPIDEALQLRLRKRPLDNASSRKLPPREIQAQIRSGMSAEDVASLTGASLEYVQRFEGPIIAERDFVVSTALSVLVHTEADPDTAHGGTGFGTIIRKRLASLGATGERWASWKEQDGGWIVKLSFTVDEIDHDARWSFEPKKHALAPLNSEATTLSKQTDSRAPLIPRLRAVSAEPMHSDNSRFDSGAFVLREPGLGNAIDDTVPHVDPIPYGRTATAGNREAVNKAAINREAPPTDNDISQTADLLDALRRRRGEREAPTSPVATDLTNGQAHPSRNSHVSVEVQPGLFDADGASVREPRSAPKRSSTGPQQRVAKKGRASMPSWEEIVFGARTDGDLA